MKTIIFMKVIDKERKKLGLTKKQLAEKAQVTHRAIIYWEKGQRSIGLENAAKLLRAVGLEIDFKNRGDSDDSSTKENK